MVAEHRPGCANIGEPDEETPARGFEAPALEAGCSTVSAGVRPDTPHHSGPRWRLPLIFSQERPVLLPQAPLSGNENHAVNSRRTVNGDFGCPLRDRADRLL